MEYDSRTRRRSTKRHRPRYNRPRLGRQSRNYRSDRDRLSRVRNRKLNAKRQKVDAGPISRSDSEQNREREAQSERAMLDSDDSCSLRPRSAVSLSLNVEVGGNCNRPRSKFFRLSNDDDRKSVDPDLTPLDDDSSSVDTASSLGDDDEERSQQSQQTANRWHLPLTDDDAIISNDDDDDDLSLHSVDEMSVSLQIESQSKKQRIDSGSRSLSTLKSKSASKSRSGLKATTKSTERERDGECLECIARKSEIQYLRGLHVAGLDMAKLMALEGELLSALSRVQRAMANQYENEKLCIVCKRFERDIVFRPCSHFSTCSECSSQLQKCPLCQSSIEHKFKIFQ